MCKAEAGKTPDFLSEIGCEDDFKALASAPLDISIPGARSTKFVVDQADGDKIYFQNTNKYPIHWEFASKNLSGMGKPFVPALPQFNMTEYFAPSRRFILGSITRYEGAKVWAMEIAPYDTAGAPMIEKAYKAIAANTYFGKELFFHPVSDAAEQVAKTFSNNPVRVKTTKELFDKVEFLPMNATTSIGRLRFIDVANLQNECLSFRDIVVLNKVPNDLAVTMGIVTEEFQTPLSHINVLARNRKVPNMWLRDAFTNKALRAYENKWVKLNVGLTGYTVTEASVKDADAWWEANRPAKIVIPKADMTKIGLVDVKKILDYKKPLRDELKAAILAFGGKGTHFAAMAGAELPDVPMPKPSGFIIPVYYYDQFMTQNGFYTKIDSLLNDSTFKNGDCKVQGDRLKALETEMENAPVDAAFSKMLTDKLAAEYPGLGLRYRSSSTAEDVGGFTGAGLYTSKSGDVNDVNKQPLNAIRKVWASVWYQRGFQEREYRQIDQKAVGMAILAHPRFANEYAQGLAQTANSYDPSGLQPAFVINAQIGDNSVAKPAPNVTTDQLIYYYFSQNQPIQYISHSNLVEASTTVLSRTQVYALGKALDAIHNFFRPAYGPTSDKPNAWYALEVDFKFDQIQGEKEPRLFIKQARPLPAPFGDESQAR